MARSAHARALRAAWPVALLAAALLAQGCRKSGPAAVEEVAPSEAFARVQGGKAVLIDVREQAELRGGMAAPALWIPTSQVAAGSASFEAFVKSLPKDRQLIFYCAAGGRAQGAAEKLAARGYHTANAGAYSDWAAAGLPTKRP